MASIISHSAAETFEFGRTLAASLEGGEIIALCGDLGAGKTHLCKGIAAGLGADADEVTSPTFTLVHEYRGGRLPVFHFDFYRLESEAEALAVGLDDYLAAGGVVLIEWADKFRPLLPAGTRWFELRETAPDVREISER
ncbi:MAG TPA: tRNA (adenosine(37)-N6)-threonylcarbamoyltransferase complex ATPase subunit type 1 TsaE [Chthoniobacteraceae bacterium]|jgi:tRNA threonylcarbamoyladenosine biosynthesis protein TsaE|nr:tRNA (adenosine(37)-N6)-threonylcarbamoyltransferase complex ATPase subunit type 1 TsaE [Chthoniobacteraceae bacterium]